MNNKKIYVVTEGEYSDYHIDAVFSTKEKAVEYIGQHGTDYSIEEYDLDEEVVKEERLWRVEFDIENGKLVTSYPTTYQVEENRDTCIVSEYLASKRRYITFFVDADTVDRAIKIASERYASVKANEYIWIRLTRPYEVFRYGHNNFERFNVKTNEFTK